MGPRAEEVVASLEQIPLLFWSPYPETPDGRVSSLWRDVVNGSRWAYGSGRGGHRVLRELTTDEADHLEARGFPNVYTYAIDGDGRIWESGLMPFERTPFLNMMPRLQFDIVKGFDTNRIIDLPPGWGRLIRRPRDGGGPVEVTGVDDADDAFYQRWRDDHPAPTS